MLRVKKVNQNMISVEWRLECSVKCQTQVSQPFALLSDTYPTSFVLTLIPSERFNVGIRSSSSGRGIVKLTTKYFYSGVDNTSIVWSFVRNLSHQIFYYVGNLDQNCSYTVTINCDITWLGSGTNEEVKLNHLPGPLSIMNVPFDQVEDSDFDIHVDNQTLSAHRVILSRHSSVLAAMFRAPMKESKENEMTIKDVEYSTMEIVLRIIYTGDTEDLNDIDTTIKVLQASEKYQMPIVKYVCECKLQLQIKDDNVLKLLDEADKHNASKLCHTCVEYIMATEDRIISRDKFEELAAEKPSIKAAVGDLGFSFGRILRIKN